MVRIRLRKVGSKAQQSFRIVAADREHPRDGRFLKALGFYNPRTNPATIHMDEAEIYRWLKNGAQPSDSVEQLFRTMGTRERFTRFLAGEAVETLLEEAAKAQAAHNISRVTSHEGGVKGKQSKKQKAAAEKKEA